MPGSEKSGTATNSLPVMTQETKHFSLKRIGWLYPIFPCQKGMTNSGDCPRKRPTKKITKQTQSMDNIQYFNHLLVVQDGLCARMFGELTVAIEPLGTTTFAPNQTTEPCPLGRGPFPWSSSPAEAGRLEEITKQSQLVYKPNNSTNLTYCPWDQAKE